VKFSILSIDALSSKKAKVYTIKYDDQDFSELQRFIYKFNDSHQEILQIAYQIIQQISNVNGIQESFFKRESPESHNVFRLMETMDLRLYCIMFSNIILLFGTGGIKVFNSVKLDDNPHLLAIRDELMKVEDAIKNRLASGSLSITINGFEGNLLDIKL
jgi:hypothetical protein